MIFNTKYMIYAPARQTDITRYIPRTAKLRVNKTTGSRVILLLSPAEDTLKTQEHMLQIIALALDMAPSCFLMKTRLRNVAELRYIGALLLRTYFPKITLQQIATLFGGMDHTTIMSGMLRGKNLIQTCDERFIKKYNTALNSVNIWLRKEAA